MYSIFKFNPFCTPNALLLPHLRSNLCKCFPAVLKFPVCMLGCNPCDVIKRLRGSFGNRVCVFCFAFLCQLNIESAILFKDDYVVNIVHIYIRLSASFTLCFDFVVRERKKVVKCLIC